MITSCSECGNNVSDKAIVCPHCGAPLLFPPKIQSINQKILCINFEGKWMAVDSKVSIWVNNDFIGDFSFIKGFSVDVPFEGNSVNVECKVGPRKFNFTPIIPNQYNDNKYYFNLQYSRLNGGFGYEMTDSSRRIMDIQHLNFVMGLIVFFFPIVGLIYGYMNLKTKPALSKSTFINSACGFGIGFLFLVLFSFQFYPDTSLLLLFISALLGGGLIGIIIIYKHFISKFF